MRTHSLPTADLLGTYYQIMQPQRRQNQQAAILKSTLHYLDGNALANTNENNTERNHANKCAECTSNTNFSTKNAARTESIKQLDQQYILRTGKAVVESHFTGRIVQTGIDDGSYFSFSDDSYKFSLFRILDAQVHPRFGTFIFVSSITPSQTRLLWKPPLDKSNLTKAYTYSLSKINFFEKINFQINDIIVVAPTHLYEMIELNTDLPY